MSGLVGIELDSRSTGRGFESCPIQKLDGNDLKVMPGSIHVRPNPGSYSKRKKRHKGSQIGTPNKH